MRKIKVCDRVSIKDICMNMTCQVLIIVLFTSLLSSVISLDLRTGTIYKIQCQITGNFFIGSTKVALDEAMKRNLLKFQRFCRGSYKSNDSIFEVMANHNYNRAYQSWQKNVVLSGKKTWFSMKKTRF